MFEMEAGDLLDSVKFSDGVKKALRAGSHCGGGELWRRSDPPQEENPALQDSFMIYSAAEGLRA